MKLALFTLVTGASRGLGMAFARELAERHQNLILVGRSVESLNEFASQLRKAKPITVVALPMDLASHGAGQRLAHAISDCNLRINLLVNNAGFGLRGEFRTLDVGRQVEMLRLSMPGKAAAECERKLCTASQGKMGRRYANSSRSRPQRIAGFGERWRADCSRRTQ